MTLADEVVKQAVSIRYAFHRKECACAFCDAVDRYKKSREEK